MEDCVDVDSMMGSMVESLLEKQPVIFEPVYTYEDTTIDFKLGGKPPKDIFYRNTVTFLTKVPSPIDPKMCSCQYLCEGDLATIKCFSCSIFHETGSYLYCKACFDHAHPWHRVSHIFSEIENDENLEYSMMISHRIADIGRYEQEGQSMLQKLRDDNYPKLEFLADDEKVDTDLRSYGRKAVALEENINDIRKRLQGQINSYNFPKINYDENGREMEETNENETESDQLVITNAPPGSVQARNYAVAAKHIQRIIRGLWAKRIVSMMLVDRIVKVWRSDVGKDFYFNRVTGASTWAPPYMLRPEHLDLLPYMQEDVDPTTVIWLCKRKCKRRRPEQWSKGGKPNETRRVANQVLKAWGRCILARQKVVKVLDTVYRRVWDAESSSYYYANVVDGSTSWEKSKAYLQHEPPVLVSDAKENTESVAQERKGAKAQAVGGKKDRIRKNNPVANRVTSKSVGLRAS